MLGIFNYSVYQIIDSSTCPNLVLILSSEFFLSLYFYISRIFVYFIIICVCWYFHFDYALFSDFL